MLPLSVENIIYSYVRQFNCLKFKKINKEIRHALTLCHECDEYKLILSRCQICCDDYCISCTYNNHYYINGKVYFNNNVIHCLPCQDNLCCQDYDDYDQNYDRSYDDYYQSQETDFHQLRYLN